MRILVLCAVAMLLAAGHSLDGVETMVEENLPENTVTAGLETHSVGESTTVKGGFDGTTFACPSGFNVAEELSGHPSGTHTGEGGISISVARFKCVCSITNPLPTCTREDPQLGTQTNVLAFYEFKAGVPDVNGEAWNALSDALKVATIDKIKELFEAHQEARSADMPTGGERRSQSTELGANAESTSGSTYVQIGSGGLCLGGTQLFAAGPNWEVAAGIVACREKCDSNTLCNGFVWWEDFGCRTYTSCNSKSSSGSANHVWRRESSTPGGFPGFGPDKCSTWPAMNDNGADCLSRWSLVDGSCAPSPSAHSPITNTACLTNDAFDNNGHDFVVYMAKWRQWNMKSSCVPCFDGSGSAAWRTGCDKCGDWSMPSGYSLVGFGDFLRLGWGDAPSETTGQDPDGVQDMPFIGKYNFPLLLADINAKLTATGCSSSQLPFRITYGLPGKEWINQYGIKETERFNFLLFELYFPCGGPLGQSNCVTPDPDPHLQSWHNNRWKYTVFRFAIQVATQNNQASNSPPEVTGKVTSVKPYVWDCEAGKPAPLAWCGGAATYEKVDGIIREAVAHARFQVAKALATGLSVSSTYDACQDDTSFQNRHGDTVNCDAYAIFNRCWQTEYSQDPDVALKHCKKHCQSLAINRRREISTGYC